MSSVVLSDSRRVRGSGCIYVLSLSPLLKGPPTDNITRTNVEVAYKSQA